MIYLNTISLLNKESLIIYISFTLFTNKIRYNQVKQILKITANKCISYIFRILSMFV